MFELLPAAYNIRAITLMMETASISETSANVQQTTRRSSPEDSHLELLSILKLFRLDSEPT
jgi:hypothetical protein